MELSTLQLWTLAVLTFLACLSPALTLSALWQKKEWRWDRLKEHLGRDGWFRTLFGRARPTILLLYLLALIGVLFWEGTLLQPAIAWEHLAVSPTDPIIIAVAVTLLLFTGGTVIQLLEGRQRMPRWTNKSVAVTAGVLILDALLILPSLQRGWSGGVILFPLLPLLQMPLLVISWILFWPLDTLLKRRILRAAANLRAAHADIPLIGIAGCVGKTTTKELLGHILEDAHPLVTPEHVNTELGVAQWLTNTLPGYLKEQRERGLQPIIIVEMGAYRTGEIALLARIVRPTIGVVTYVTNQHLALFKTREAIVESNRELVRALPSTGKAFLNGDQPDVRSIAPASTAGVSFAGVGPANALRAADIRETENGLAFDIEGAKIQIPFHGLHNVTNILLAIAVARHLGLPMDQIAEKCATAQSPAKTFDVQRLQGVTVLNDTHNSSGASVEAAIRWARSRGEKPKILLMSGIIELGKEEAKTHESIGTLARDVFDTVIVLDRRHAKQVERGLGRPVSALRSDTPRLATGSLLVCTGRMSSATIERLLPTAS